MKGEGFNIRAIYLTSAKFSEEGKVFIEEMNKGGNKSMLLNTGYDREALIELLRAYGFGSEIKIIEKFYTSFKK